MYIAALAVAASCSVGFQQLVQSAEGFAQECFIFYCSNALCRRLHQWLVSRSYHASYGWSDWMPSASQQLKEQLASSSWNRHSSCVVRLFYTATIVLWFIMSRMMLKLDRKRRRLAVIDIQRRTRSTTPLQWFELLLIGTRLSLLWPML